MMKPKTKFKKKYFPDESKTFLSKEGRSRRVELSPPVWGCWVPSSPRDVSRRELLTSGYEVRQEVVSSAPFEEVRDGVTQRGTRRVAQELWIPERYQQSVLPNIPFRLYDEQDVARLQGAPDFLILTGKEAKAFVERRKVQAEEERRISEAKRAERDRQYLEEEEERVARLLGREP